MQNKKELSKQTKLRYPAVPLLNIDPYFNIWSFSDFLTDDVTRHWTGVKNQIVGMIKYNGKVFRFMGKCASGSRFYYSEPKALPQIDVTVTPTKTIYTFENDDLTLIVTFLNPIPTDDMLLMSRPIAYMEYKVLPKKEIEPPKVYFDIAAECCVDNPKQSVVSDRNEYGIYCGNAEQNILNKSGDDIRIDWGYLCLLDKDGFFAEALPMRDAFANDEKADFLTENVPYNVFDYNPVMAVVKIGFDGVIAIAYNDIKSIQYFGKNLDAYYKSNGDTFDDICKNALSEYTVIKNKCTEFDKKQISAAKAISNDYADIISYAYRQAVASHKLCYDEKGILFISKECFSDGDAATLDVTYPSVPLFLVTNPELVKGMLRPIFDFAKTDKWNFGFAPHDCGRYPILNGQDYGRDRETGEISEDKQMPIEESGNILLCVYAVCRMLDNFDYANENKELLKKWVQYLIDYGYDPNNQLCTDDFAGHMAHNCNLSVKAILGIYAYGEMFECNEYKEKAKEFAKKWEKDTFENNHYKLAFDKENSWSLKYNLAWDRLFGFGVFDKSVFETETKYYLTKLEKYGIPLDSRSDMAKSDWNIWATALSDDTEYRDAIIRSIWTMVNETRERVPLTDYYNVKTGRQWQCGYYKRPWGFSNRTVVGGFWMPLLMKKIQKNGGDINMT